MSELAINGGPKTLPGGLGVRWPQSDHRDEEAVLKVLRSGAWWRGGTVETQAASETGRFERGFAAYHDAPHALAVANGTIALELALRAGGVQSGDEVIVPALSFVVTASAALTIGAFPVFADCDPRTFQIDPAAIEAAITRRTAAICIVHFGGYPADLDRIVAIAKKHKLLLVEDCAHAHATQWRGKGAGSYGDFGTFSFQQSKSLTSGEGGMLLARQLAGWQAAYRFHNLGRLEHSGFYDFHEISSNYRITDFQGALLNTQFEKMKTQVPQKIKAAEKLNASLRGIGGVEPLPDDPRITRLGYYFYLFRYKAEEFGGLPRTEFLRALNAEGVPCGHTYGKPIYKYPLFQNLKVPAKYTLSKYKKVCCPHTERVLSEEVCNLPHTALLADSATVEQISAAILKIKENVRELMSASNHTARKSKPVPIKMNRGIQRTKAVVMA